jgi:hypothetical protein
VYQNVLWNATIRLEECERQLYAAKATLAPLSQSRPEQANAGAIGVDAAYLKIIKEAERRSKKDFRQSHRRGERGIVIGPTEGDFRRHTFRALQNARRIRNILSGDASFKLAIIMSQEHISILKECDGKTSKLYREACRLWANGTLFDDVIATAEMVPYKANDNHTLDGSSNYWLRALSSYINAPYKVTLFLDSDAYTCPGFERLFELADNRPRNVYWQLPSMQKVDLAIGMDQYPVSDLNNHGHWLPGDEKLLHDFLYFPERNTGVVLFHFYRPLLHIFAHFLPLVGEHIYKHVATLKNKAVNDQQPFRVALYLFRRLFPEFNEQQIPMHASCRNYPGRVYAGTDGFKNGMYPIQSNGKHCSECSCTPCLMNHNGKTHFLAVNGRNGWKDDRYFHNITKQ